MNKIIFLFFVVASFLLASTLNLQAQSDYADLVEKIKNFNQQIVGLKQVVQTKANLTQIVKLSDSLLTHQIALSNYCVRAMKTDSTSLRQCAKDLKSFASSCFAKLTRLKQEHDSIAKILGKPPFMSEEFNELSQDFSHHIPPLPTLPKPYKKLYEKIPKKPKDLKSTLLALEAYNKAEAERNTTYLSISSNLRKQSEDCNKTFTRKKILCELLEAQLKNKLASLKEVPSTPPKPKPQEKSQQGISSKDEKKLLKSLRKGESETGTYKVLPLDRVHEIVEDKKGYHYIIDITSPADQQILFFKGGKYVMDIENKLYVTSLDSALDRIDRAIEDQNIADEGWCLYLLGGADGIWQGGTLPQDQGKTFYNITMFRKSSSGNLFAHDLVDVPYPYNFTNEHLPNLRSAYVQSEINEGKKFKDKAFILDGKVSTTFIKPEDRKVTIILYVKSQ